MKVKKRSLSQIDRLAWLSGWTSTLVGLAAVLSMLILGSCAMARTAQHIMGFSLVFDVQTDRSVDIWQTIKKMGNHLSQGPAGTQQVGATRLWTSRSESYPCVCWPSTSPTPPPYTSCLSMAMLDSKAHPCTPYHPATNGWLRRPMKGVHHFSGNKKIYRYSGFYIDLDLNKDVNTTLAQYENNDWLDWNTQAVVLEAALYDPYTACIMYIQLGFELDPSKLWRGTTTIWATCEGCTQVKNWMSALLKLALTLHIVTLILEIPWTFLKGFFFGTLPRPALRWLSKTLVLNLVVLGMYCAVLVTEIIVQGHLKQVWQVPREGTSVFPNEIAVGITDIADTFTLLLVALALLLSAQVCARTLSELGVVMGRLIRLLAIVAVLMVPFSVALYQLGPTVNILSNMGDSVLAVIAAFLGEIDVTRLLAATNITGLVLFFLLFTVFTLLLFPFVVEVLTYRPPLQGESPQPTQDLFRFSERLAMLLSAHL